MKLKDPQTEKTSNEFEDSKDKDICEGIIRVGEIKEDNHLTTYEEISEKTIPNTSLQEEFINLDTD